MKLRELYNKPIERTVDPAVSATKLDENTERIEIEEYVFTDEILNGLYRILNALKNNRDFHHIGIWIDGYYGSGKSHFLKYLDYCITPHTAEKALHRLLEAVKAIDPYDDKHYLCFDYAQLEEISRWLLQKAQVDTVIFNLETSHDESHDRELSFLQVFWSKFNQHRGFNPFNIWLAQHLEKPLAAKGLFDQFKQRIADEADGADWNDPSTAADIIDNELEWALDIAKEIAPTLDTESIRERIVKRDTNLSIERFAQELKAYIDEKSEDYRLIFLADEVSQFINKGRDRYLNLQEIITRLSETCGNQVWVACTAQQDLTELMDDCRIAEERDNEGKIKGRFEVMVSLKGTQPELITQKRILDKKEDVKPALEAMYEAQKDSFNLQFRLPTSYTGYETEDDFVAYYPFVPYQFKLITKVFDSFLNLGYVSKEVKGNSRSIIKVVHATAKNQADEPVGKFVSFDELYNSMFEEGLQARGQKAVENAQHMASTYSRNPELARRVANVLFMICNISKNDQLLFPASIDNITSLLINEMKTPRLTIKDEVEKIIEYLCDNNIIRPEHGKEGVPDTYSFYSEEEMKVAQLIKSQKPDNNTQAEQLKDVFFKYLSSLKNKESYGTRTFAVGASIKQRNFMSNNADVIVDFYMDVDYDNAETLALNNPRNRMVYYVGPQFRQNKRLFNAFYSYCQVNAYMATPVLNEENANTRRDFEARTKEIYNTIILPGFRQILDTCPVISGMTVLTEADLGVKKGAERYQLAIQKHLSSIYTKANLVGGTMPQNSERFKQAVLRNVEPGEYEGMNAPLTAAENEVEIYLNNQFVETNASDIVTKFTKEPYGWNPVCTLYVVNELVRRHKRDYAYSNNPNVETATVARNLLTETNKFTLRVGKAISAEVIHRFVEAWKDIFGTTDVFATNDSTQLFRLSREKDSDKGLERRREAYQKQLNIIGTYPFASPIRQAIELFDRWLSERDPLTYFEAVIADHAAGREVMDRCKEVIQFTHDQLDNYKGLLLFVKDNQLNFPFVPIDLQPKTAELQQIESDELPDKNLRMYARLQKELRFALDKKRQELKEKIALAYNEVFDQLEETAKSQQVDLSVLPDRQQTISSKQSPSNIMALERNLSTDDFYQKMIGVILDHVKKEDKDHDTKKPEIRQASLQTKTQLPLKTEDDVDRYLASLKEQILKLMVDHDGIMIIK